MDYNPLISIILPVYNGQKYLSISIESILNQTYNNIELIIVNDCSTDNTLNISNQYAEKDGRVRIINNNENKKLPTSLNIGHKEAKGDFITWTSDDNFYEINAVQDLLNEISEKESDIVYSNFNLIDNEGNNVREINLPSFENIIFGNVICCCFLYKRQVFERNKGYNESLFLVEDYDFWLRAITHSRFSQVKSVLYNYRKHEKSLTNQISSDNEKYLMWKSNIKTMYLSFWRNFSETYCFEMAELSSKILMYQTVSFDWLEVNNTKIYEVKTKLKLNQNFKKGNLLEKVFTQKTIEIIIMEKERKAIF